jgi:hypothetical protein
LSFQRKKKMGARQNLLLGFQAIALASRLVLPMAAHLATSKPDDRVCARHAPVHAGLLQPVADYSFCTRLRPRQIRQTPRPSEIPISHPLGVRQEVFYFCCRKPYQDLLLGLIYLKAQISPRFICVFAPLWLIPNLRGIPMSQTYHSTL